jgi:hypothetical protein
MDTEGLEGIRPIQIDLWANDRKTDYTEVDSEPPIKSPFRQVRLYRVEVSENLVNEMVRGLISILQ